MFTQFIAAAALAAAATGAQAGEAQDRIFRLGLLADVEIGQTLVYSRDRVAPPALQASPPIDGGTVAVTVAEGDAGARVARVDVASDDQPSSRATLPADGGHPVLLLFLEATARAVAEATGGSPFYIRNRIREALGADAPLEPIEIAVAGATIPAEAATFRPFVDDPNRAKMGPFADLALTMVLSDAVPGGFARLEAVAGAGDAAGPAFEDAMAFVRLEED